MFATDDNQYGWKSELCMVCSNAYTEVSFDKISIEQIEDLVDDDSLFWFIGIGFLVAILLLAIGCYIKIRKEHIVVKSNTERI